MATVPTQTKDFPNGNPWGVTNTTADVQITLNQLVHAAVTAGHGLNWHQSIASDIGAQAELMWKTSALQACVYELNTQRVPNRPPRLRLAPTDRYNKMDPSERRALAYHLGITWAVAWARQALGIPWLLHLDIYRQQQGVNLQVGNSRPDLIGRHPNGTWSVFEAKGRATAPSPVAEAAAKLQSQRVVTIGGVPPTSCFAIFSYFATDAQAVGTKKPKVLQARILDPVPRDDTDSISLPLFTPDKFFELYYQPWLLLLRNGGTQTTKQLPPTSKFIHSALKSPPEGPDLFIWRYLADLDFQVGMLAEVKYLLEIELYDQIPEAIQRVTAKEGFAAQYPHWAGDGLIIEPGETWNKLWLKK